MQKKQIQLLFVFFAAFYLVLEVFVPYHWSRIIIKVIPIYLLVPYAASYLSGIPRTLVIAGILAGSVGDILLDFAGGGGLQHLFVPGLAAFLIGHLIYIIALSKLPRKPGGSKDWIQGSFPFIIAIGLGIPIYSSLSASEQGQALIIPVISYIAVISIMSAVAIVKSGKGMILGIAALIFMASDSMIAIRNFILHKEDVTETVSLAFRFAIMLTYYMAQYGIVAGTEEAQKNHRS